MRRSLVRTLEERARRLGAPLRAFDVAALELARPSRGGGPDELRREGWLYELKLDGARLVADKRGDDVDLRYRTARLATAAYPEIAEAVRALGEGDVVLDGEVVAVGRGGRPSFESLGARIRRARDAMDVPVAFVAFDLLAIGARDVRSLPLDARKALLAALPTSPHLQIVPHVTDGLALYRFCDAEGLEGVVAKRADSAYGERGAWRKFKRTQEDEFVVLGFVRDAQGAVESVTIGSHVEGALVALGRCDLALFGGRRALVEILEPRASASRRRWCEVPAEIVVRVRFLGWTERGKLREPVLVGVRHDVTARECVVT